MARSRIDRAFGQGPPSANRDAANDTTAPEYVPTPVGELVLPTAAAAVGSANEIPAVAEPSLDTLSPYDGFTWFPDLLRELHSSTLV